jgi:hypothetical protein
MLHQVLHLVVVADRVEGQADAVPRQLPGELRIAHVRITAEVRPHQRDGERVPAQAVDDGQGRLPLLLAGRLVEVGERVAPRPRLPVARGVRVARELAIAEE